MRCADKNFGAERTLVAAGERLECSSLKDLSGSSGEKRNRASTAPLTIIASKVVSREQKSSKNCQSSNGSSSSSYPS